MSYPLTLLSFLSPLAWPLSSEGCGGWVAWPPLRNALWFVVEQCRRSMGVGGKRWPQPLPP